MQNVTKGSIDALLHQKRISDTVLGATCGFAFYWLSFSIVFMTYGSNTLFLLLYTWPFFLTLVPVSVLLGIIINMLVNGHFFYTLLLSSITVFSLFWLVFRFLSGW